MQLTTEQRKQQAKSLKENQILKEALEETERSLYLNWRASRDVGEREQLYSTQTALTLLRNKIDAAIKRELGDKS